jgi:rifampicin phosphotransferase
VTTATPPTQFPQPHEIEGSWDWDKIHAPRPLTPQAGDAIIMSMAEGFTIAQHDFGSTLALHCRMVNNYLYAAFTPDPSYTPPTTDLEAYTRQLDRISAGIGERWKTEWEPSLVPILEWARRTDFSTMSDQQLLEAYEQWHQHHVYFWTIHGWINLSLVPATALSDFYAEEIEPEDPNEGWQLIQGYRTKSVEAGEGLWRLSRAVKASAELTKLFETLEPAQLTEALRGSAEGQQLLSDFRAYLEEFGWRSDGIYELAAETWREDPTIPLNTIQGYMRLPDEDDPKNSVERATRRRQELTARAREKLAGSPDKLQRFDDLMEAAKHNLSVTEDHSYWIDQMSVAAYRRFLLQVGQRLVERGVIDKPDDVFFLYNAELLQALQSGGDYREPVAQRRTAMDGAGRVVPPFHLGAPTAPSNDPFFIAVVDKMLGLLPVEPSSDPEVITGVAASPGSVQGKAKVVRSLVEASKLQQGDIMVCEMTVPTWVPLFATVSGIVADSGGILSHCAIVAREFHLPCVVGTRVGTEVIKDDMTITVDGTKGLVRIDSRR